MHQLYVRLGIMIGAFMLIHTAQATHQVGGQIEMKLVGDVPGHYKIIVTNYLEAGQRANQQTGGAVGIFRKRDNGFMKEFTLVETGTRSSVVFTNAFCANQQNLNFIVATFGADLYLTPADYTDAQGYYMSYQTRNRNGSISNIANPSQIGYTFYLEFPALQQNGRIVENSSPHFAAINGEYLCLGEAFTFPFGGTDPDGDQLRYSLVTPLDQKGVRGAANAVSAGPYPEVAWLSGYDATNAIPGVPAMSVNSTTGQLTGKPSKTGLFVFAVNVEEYRNGVKIGEVRRDFQLLVVECPPLTTPDPAVRIQAKPADLRSLTLCQGQTTTIQAADNPAWNYQWRQNGINLAGATNSSLTVQEAGDYTVYVSLKNACSKAADSETVQISVIGTESTLARSGHLCATTGSVSFTVTNAAGAAVQWYHDGQPIPGQTFDSVRTQQPGQFYAQLAYAQVGCVARTARTDVSRSAAVLPAISAQQPQLCPNSTLTLEASGGVSYSWQQDTQPPSLTTTATTLTITGVGSYVVTATDFYGCTGTSAPFVVTAVPPVTVQLDSIPDMCGTNVPVVTLVGQPAGGVFAGLGVTGNVFNAQVAGVGNHTIAYTVRPAPFCDGVVATRRAVVAPIPTISFPDTLVTYYGNTFALKPVFTGNPIRFAWSPPTFLDNPLIAGPTVVQITEPVMYRLAVSNASGCSASDSIRIRIVERVYVPDAFSPNGDGLNDYWELIGIEAFPEAIVTIFNRWGEVIFQSDRGYHQPFVGLLNGNEVPAGTYAYTLSTAPERPVMHGLLLLMR